jgi:hypothetical protein
LGMSSLILVEEYIFRKGRRHLYLVAITSIKNSRLLR